MLTLPSQLHQCVTSATEVNALIQYVCSDSRTRPILILTVAKGKRTPDINATALADTLGAMLDVVVVPNDVLGQTLTDGFARSGHADISVYQGAVRLYPAGAAGTLTPVSAPLFFVDTPQHRDKLFDALSQLLPDVRSALEIRGQLNILHEHGTAHRVAFLDELRGKFPPRQVSSVAEARELAAFLVSPDRHLPVMIVSHIRADQKPFVDVNLLSGLLHGITYVVELTTQAAVSELKLHVISQAAVYGEAGRVYPTGTLWNRPDAQLRLFLPNEHISRMLLTNMMAAEALSLRANDIRSSETWSDYWDERWGSAYPAQS